MEPSGMRGYGIQRNTEFVFFEGGIEKQNQ